MLRGAVVFFVLLFVALQAQAQVKLPGQKSIPGISRYELTKSSGPSGTKAQADGEPFISPKDSLLKLQKQVEFQLLPTGFIPSQEIEPDAFRRKSLRYGIAYFKDSLVPNVSGFKDVLLGVRLDTRNGLLEIKYYRVATIIDPSALQFSENRSSLAILPDNQGTALLSLFEGSKQDIISFEGVFSDNPHPANSIGGDDVDGVRADITNGQFIVFVRGGSNRASLFALLTDASLQQIETYELLKDLTSTDVSTIFDILPAPISNSRTANGSSIAGKK